MDVKHRSESFLALVCLLYRLAIPFSCLMTLYVIAMWRVALPSYDIVDHHAFLAAAALGELDWAGLWERHNAVHLIVLPKLVFWLDVWLLAGQGWLVTTFSAVAIMATSLLVWRQVCQLAHLSVLEKGAFGLLFLLSATSVLMAESLLNPIDIQWSLLSFGLVLFANGLAAQGYWSAGRIASLIVGCLISWLSSAPFSIMLLAGILTLLLTRDGDRRINANLVSRRFLLFLLGLSILVFVWEWLALHFEWPLFFPMLYKMLMVMNDSGSTETFLRNNPEFYIEWLTNAIVFIGRFVLVPLGHEWYWPLLLAIPLFLWSFAIWKSVLQWQAGQRFFVFLTLFVMLLAVAAGAMRFFTLYNYRHANTGSLLLLSSLALIYSSCQWRSRSNVLAAGLLLYGAQFMVAIVDESGAWAFEGRNTTRMLQIGDALGIRDPAKFSPVWKDDEANREVVERSREIFRKQRVGVYGSRDYARYLGEIPLPANEVMCEYNLIRLGQHAPDPLAFVLRAQARTVDGEYFTQALILAGDVAVGWAAAEMPSDILWQQLREPWLFGGQMRLSKPLPVSVEVVAFDSQRRCQSWQLPLPAILPAPIN